MRYIRKRCMAYVAAIVLCLSAVLPAQAAQVGGTTTIAVSSSSMEVGDRLTRHGEALRGRNDPTAI